MFGSLPEFMHIAVILATNLLPLFGVLFWGWSLPAVVLYYWLENIIIGVITIFKLILIRKEGTNPFTAEYIFYKVLIVAGFIFHYGGLAALSGLFVSIIFKTRYNVPMNEVAFTAMSLSAGYIFSYFTQFIKNKEYFKRTTVSQMIQPYPRVAALMLTIMVGGFVAKSFGGQLFALIFLIALKLLQEIILYRIQDKQNKKYAEGNDAL